LVIPVDEGGWYSKEEKQVGFHLEEISEDDVKATNKNLRGLYENPGGLFENRGGIV
jgi:hypothetical protein